MSHGGFFLFDGECHMFFCFFYFAGGDLFGLISAILIFFSVEFGFASDEW